MKFTIEQVKFDDKLSGYHNFYVEKEGNEHMDLFKLHYNWATRIMGFVSPRKNKTPAVRTGVSNSGYPKSVNDAQFSRENYYIQSHCGDNRDGTLF